MLKIAIIASTNGGVLGKLLELDYFYKRITVVYSDRECGAIEKARNNNIDWKIFDESDALKFSNILLKEIKQNKYDLYISFYTKLFRGELVSYLKFKLINLHPSILPACPGVDGFGDTIKSGSKFIGSTIHFIDEGMDTGVPIIQAARPYNKNISLEENRHTIFVQQWRMLLQVIKWFEDERIEINENKMSVNIKNAKYELSEFSPNLD